MTLKVLPLDFWMKYADYRDDCDVVPTEPVFHYDAIFMTGNEWWFECGGEAFTYDTPERVIDAIEQTKFRLGIDDEFILRDCEVQALKVLTTFSKDAKLRDQVRKILYRHEQSVQIRDTGRTVRKVGLTLTHRRKKKK